ncbi:alpha/beta hydrolase [Spirosoma sp. BT702]|uniref:Alpha/beta hydrolase n=1 Tax=Spirosoma profusum TaxID=2771354 RepID=A0A926XYH4_9BACT|nr:alpha/beta hydrolase [Spirosoma profusum]MBD2702565.1 alpha/beta hydrolase [Spirosoma profusum]
MNSIPISYFQAEGNQIAYRKFGCGRSILLAFHGFGQTSQVYLPVQKQLSREFTVFAIDLFFHGDSRYADDQLLTNQNWNDLLRSFLKEQRIERFSLMGFSLGGRFALTMVEVFADCLDQLMLIAPDGITRSIWYRLATGSALGRSTFHYVLAHLPLLTTFGHTLTRLGLLNRTAMRFAEISLATSARRELVYKSWTQFRLIQPDLKLISKNLNDRAIRVRFFTGAYDRIVPGSYILPLTKRLQHYELAVLETGHNHLIELAGERL